MRLNDRYEIEATIATGGMGTVYRGRDERLHRSVAIKILKDHLSTDARFVERFRREARAVASLSHPNIASLFDYGEDEGRHYIVMELVEGRDLATLLRDDGAFEPERARVVAEQVSNALAVAHAAGIVHRDVKPANVLLTAEGDAKVTDFGIARATGDSTLTMTGSILGTAHYLTPEQAAGEPATPASDVYATGIVLFEMLTGDVPFTADSPVVVASRHMNEEVPAPSSIVPTVPPHLDEVVRVATAKDPRDRYPDAAALGAALRGSPAPGAAAPAAAAVTEVLPGPASQTAPIPAPAPRSFDVRRLSVGVIGGLLVIALALLAFRLVEDPASETRKEGVVEGAAESSPAPEETLSTVPDVRGMDLAEAGEAIVQRGLVPVVDGGGESGTVFGVEPPPGSEVSPGTTVTLTLAEEEPDDDDDDDDEEGGGPPPHSEGKGKDKGKKDK